MIKNFKKEIEKTMSDIEWNFVGILDTKKQLHPIPKNIQIQALFEYLAMKRLKLLSKRWKCRLIGADNTRQYPDATLEDGKLGKKKIAIDIKTTRRKENSLPPQESKFAFRYSAPRVKRLQTFSITLPNLIHQLKKRLSKS